MKSNDTRTNSENPLRIGRVLDGKTMSRKVLETGGTVGLTSKKRGEKENGNLAMF